MSHFTRIAIEIKNGSLLKQVLEDLGYPVKQNALIRGYLSSTTNAEYVIQMPNSYDIGFSKLENYYELITDLWGVALNLEQFIGEIKQAYATKIVLESASEQGFTIEQQEILEDGTIRIVIGRWT